MPDGTYAIVYPVNTVEEVFLDTTKKVNLAQAMNVRKKPIDCGTSVPANIVTTEDGGNADSLYSMHMIIDGGSAGF